MGPAGAGSRDTGRFVSRDAGGWIAALDLRPHPEGGHYRESYRATDTIAVTCLPEPFGGDRPVSTAIYYLLAGAERSRLHRLASDELWHFYAGSPLTVFTLDDRGQRRDLLLGPDPERGQSFQVLVPAGRWFGAALQRPAAGSFALVGCTVAPGFDFAEFELADPAEATRRFPEHAELIARLT